MNKEQRLVYYNKPAWISTLEQAIDVNWMDSLLYNLDLFHLSTCFPKSVLELGASQGQFANKISTALDIKDITCVDIAVKSVEEGKKKFPQFEWFLCDMIDFVPAKKYDIVTILHCYYCLNTDERPALLKSVSDNMLNDKGCLLISFGDINWDQYNMTYEDVYREIAGVFDVMSIIRNQEIIPVNNPDPSLPMVLGRWFTSILAKKK